MAAAPTDDARDLIAILTERRLTVAVAESLTGGLLVAELIGVPGASVVVLGGVVAYNTELKSRLLGVDAGLLAEHGPVHPEVARRMATGVRGALAVGGRDADIGISTTGVAGPGPQDGHPAGTVFLGFAMGSTVWSARLELAGDRQRIRSASVSEALRRLKEALNAGE
ncbi:MAG TPA: nicotinamide-nucleotide amidohydrolase family protein [Lacisediminihabitans sp.]|uniref:CinA family protein n=1 Tax=Lacisediminihabitans sp. TaxID=2787631 RepID=UPI002EDA0A3E